MRLLIPSATKRSATQKAESIRAQGILSPLLVRPLTENGFEIVFGERRYRAAQLAEQDSVPVRIKQMTDAEALEAQLVENLIRAEIHPMEEAKGFLALLTLEDPKYSIEQIAAKAGKPPAFVASRLKLTDLIPAAVEAFYAGEIGVGHSLLLAKLPADQQEQALSACFKEVYNGSAKPKSLSALSEASQRNGANLHNLCALSADKSSKPKCSRFPRRNHQASLALSPLAKGS